MKSKVNRDIYVLSALGEAEVYMNLSRKAQWEEKRVENGALKDTNIQKVQEKQEPAKEMEKNNPESEKGSWESGVMDLKTRENVKKEEVIKNIGTIIKPNKPPC